MQTTIFSGTIKRIHINKQIIASNRKYGRNDPPITVKHGRENIRCQEVDIDGPCKVVHRPEKPLKCGAKVWIETHSKVVTKGRPA